MPYKDKEKESKNKKEYYIKNRESLKEKMRFRGARWYQNNIEKIRKLHREYYANNKEKESLRHKVLYQKNRKKYLQQGKELYFKNREKILLRHREYNKNNKGKLLKYKGGWQKIRRKINSRYKLNENMGSAMARSLKGIKSGHPWQQFVNYTLEDLIKHLEGKFDKNMDWKNYGTYWAVDHIKPRSLFSYSSIKDSQFKECWDLKNLQPLEKIENIKKGNRYINENYYHVLLLLPKKY